MFSGTSAKQNFVLMVMIKVSARQYFHWVRQFILHDVYPGTSIANQTGVLDCIWEIYAANTLG